MLFPNFHIYANQCTQKHKSILEGSWVDYESWFLFYFIFIWLQDKGNISALFVTCDMLSTQELANIVYQRLLFSCYVQLFATSWTAAHQASLFFTISQNLLELMSIESVMPFNYLILCHLLLLPSSIIPSIRIFSNESVLHITWPKYWSFSISPSNEYSGLISFRTDWFDFLAVSMDSQESSPTPQFKTINSSALSFL